MQTIVYTMSNYKISQIKRKQDALIEIEKLRHLHTCTCVQDINRIEIEKLRHYKVHTCTCTCLHVQGIKRIGIEKLLP